MTKRTDRERLMIKRLGVKRCYYQKKYGSVPKEITDALAKLGVGEQKQKKQKASTSASFVEYRPPSETTDITIEANGVKVTVHDEAGLRIIMKAFGMEARNEKWPVAYKGKDPSVCLHEASQYGLLVS